MKECQVERKIMMISEEPIRVIELFHRLNRRLMKPVEHEATTWILPSRPPIQKKPNIQVHPNLHTRLYHGFRGYKVLEWQTCNKVWKEMGDIGTHILHLKMQKVKLEKLNLTKLWKASFLGIDPFNFSSWDTFPKEEEYALGVYGDWEPVVAPNPNSLIFEHQPTKTKVYPPSVIVWKSRDAEPVKMSFCTPLDLQ